MSAPNEGRGWQREQGPEAEGHAWRSRAVPEDAGAGQGDEGGEGPEAEGHFYRIGF